MRDLLQKIKEATLSLSDSAETNQWERVLEIAQENHGLLRELSEKIAKGEELTPAEMHLLKSIRDLHEKNTEVLTQHKNRIGQQLVELTNGKQAILNFKKMNLRKNHFVDFLH